MKGLGCSAWERTCSLTADVDEQALHPRVGAAAALAAGNSTAALLCMWHRVPQNGVTGLRTVWSPCHVGGCRLKWTLRDGAEELAVKASVDALREEGATASAAQTVLRQQCNPTPEPGLTHVIDRTDP